MAANPAINLLPDPTAEIELLSIDNNEFAKGLDAATQAIYHAKHEVITPLALAQLIMGPVCQYSGPSLEVIQNLSVAKRNQLFATVIRHHVGYMPDVPGFRAHSWLSGWQLLANACAYQHCGMHSMLIADVMDGVIVYDYIKADKRPQSTIPIEFCVKANPSSESIHEIGPKSLGGHNWEKDQKFIDACKTWCAPEDLRMGPCPLFAWIAVSKKVEDFKDAATAKDFWTAQLLGIIDYDFDKDKENMPGAITDAVIRTAKMAVEYQGPMRGAAWVGLLTMDQQLYNRHKQHQWVAEAKGPFTLGPEQISPQQFAQAAYVDCAALAPFAYQSAEDFTASRNAMFVAVVFANMHEFLYDMGSSSRISGVGYAYSTGAFNLDLPQAWVVHYIDVMAKKALNGPADQHCLYGENALFATCVWDIFNVRYRAWERFVKYTRLLQEAAKYKNKVAQAILARAKDGMVLADQDFNLDIGEMWEQALNLENVYKLCPRTQFVTQYVISRSFLIEANENGFTFPEICDKCAPEFFSVLQTTNDTVEAIPGLPASVTESDSVLFATIIRRACCWAVGPKCCEACACQIGFWANDMSDRVVVALMEDEQKVSNRDWLLMNYMIGCVAFSPTRLISITAGFDTAVAVKFEKDAMGVRDVVDC